MYCPKCGIQTPDRAAFCRGCGSNVSLVPQALTGELGDKLKKPPSLAEAITTIFSGLGFVAAAIATFYYAPAGRIWWYWMFIPAFPLFGRGIAALVELRLAHGRAAAAQLPAPPARNTGEIAAGEPNKLAAPPSVVEATTRHLDHAGE